MNKNKIKLKYFDEDSIETMEKIIKIALAEGYIEKN